MIKEYFFLRKFKDDGYTVLDIILNLHDLGSLYYFLSSDLRCRDNEFLYNPINLYNSSFIYHDIEHKLLYIGYAPWLIDENIDSPEEEDLADHLKTIESCKISLDNYLYIKDRWIEFKKNVSPFLLLYRDDLDWIDLKGFKTLEAMQDFVREHQREILH